MGRLRPGANAGDPGARRSRRDRTDGAQRSRSRARAVGRRRTGRIDGGYRLQARAAAAAPRQARGFPRPGRRRCPLCPIAANIIAALDGLADRLAKLGCTVLRTSSKLPDLARTTRDYVELLAAFFSADTPPQERLRSEAAAPALSPDDLSLTDAFLRGQTMSHAAWIRTTRIRGGLRAGWQPLFEESTLCRATDADRRLPARPLLAERDTPTRYRRQEDALRQPDRPGRHRDLERSVGDHHADRT